MLKIVDRQQKAGHSEQVAENEQQVSLWNDNPNEQQANSWVDYSPVDQQGWVGRRNKQKFREGEEVAGAQNNGTGERAIREQGPTNSAEVQRVVLQEDRSRDVDQVEGNVGIGEHD